MTAHTNLHAIVPFNVHPGPRDLIIDDKAKGGETGKDHFYSLQNCDFGINRFALTYQLLPHLSYGRTGEKIRLAESYGPPPEVKAANRLNLLRFEIKNVFSSDSK